MINNIADIIREELGDEAFIAWERQAISVELPPGLDPAADSAVVSLERTWEIVERLGLVELTPVVTFQGRLIVAWCQAHWVIRDFNEDASSFLLRARMRIGCHE